VAKWASILSDIFTRKVVHPPDEDLELLALGRLSGTGAEAIRAHATDCSACALRLAEARQFADDLFRLSGAGHLEARGENRISTKAAALLRILDPWCGATLGVRVLNVSRTGMCLLAPGVLESGAQIEVLFKDMVVLGEVRYCNRAGDKFKIGVWLRSVDHVKHL